MSDCFDHAADAYNDLLFGQSSEYSEELWELNTHQNKTMWHHKPNNNKGYINISLQGEKNGYRDK